MEKRIKSLFLEARKNNNLVAKNLFSVIVGTIENERISKKVGPEDTISDAEVEIIVEKLLKSVRETIKLKITSDLFDEKELLESLLPKELSLTDISHLLGDAIEAGEVKNIGQAMAVFAGKRVDRGLVSQLAKARLG